MPRAFGSLPLSLILLGLAHAAGAATATNDTVAVTTSTESAINVLTNDLPAGQIAVISATQPAHGRVLQQNGGVRYLPTAGYTGADTFNYTIREGMTIGAVGRLPLATFGTGASAVPVMSSGFGSALALVPGSITDYYIMTDRGPNAGGIGTNKVFPVPNFAPQIARVTPNNSSIGGYRVVSIITLKRAAGAPANAFGANTLTGLPNSFNPTTGIAVAAGGAAITPGTDDYGIDSEGLVALADGTFWVSDEYGPYISHFSATGVELERIAPSSLNISTVVGHSTHSLPSVLKKRFENKGMEGLTVTPDGTKLVGIMQSPLDNLTTGAADVKKGVVNRIVVYDLATGVTQQYAYLLERTASGVPNTTVSEIAAITNTKFLVDERDSKFPNDTSSNGASIFKRVYEIDITAATDLSDGASNATDGAAGKLFTGGKTLEDITYPTASANLTTAAVSATLVAASVQPTTKRLVVDLLTIGNAYAYDHDKIEGLAVISTTTDPTFGTVAAKIAISNDDDFGVTDASPAADTPAAKVTPQGVTDFNEIMTIDLTNTATATAAVAITVGPTASYLIPSASGVTTKALFTVGDSVNTKPDGFTPYRMAGIPDGLGAFDNGDGTFTMLMNHELGTAGTPAVAVGVARAHGSAGAFVSKWTINKTTLAVTKIEDLTSSPTNVFTWNGTAYNAGGTSAWNRFCSADLPAVSAYLNGTKGTSERIFMDGEESGAEARGFAHIVTGPNAGKSYELPYIGKHSHENVVANPFAQDTTIVATTDDSSPGQVYIYVGQKRAAGTEIEKAGLVGGNLYGVKVTGFPLEDRAAPFGGLAKNASLPFTLANLGDVSAKTGAVQQTESVTAGITEFLRPEDSCWDPVNPKNLYFVTTDQADEIKNGLALGTKVGRSRLWKLAFTNLATPELGGQLTMLVDGSEDPGAQMFDNLTVDTQGRIVLCEDIGGFPASGKVWVYSIANKTLTTIAKHDPAKFGDRIAGVTTLPTAPFTNDEETSGVMDAAAILGTGWYLIDVQAHYATDSELVEGGQLLAMFVPASVGAAPPVIAPPVVVPPAVETPARNGSCGIGTGIGLLSLLGLLLGLRARLRR